MVQEALKIPTTVAELEEFGAELRIAASFDEYLEWVDRCEFNIEYFNNEITIMGNASYYHEKLVMLIGIALSKILPSKYNILGSNIKIHVPDLRSPDNFNADVSVVEGEPEFMVLPSGRTSEGTILNPKIVVEVTSKRTISHDFGDKLLAYKKIATLQQVIFVSQYQNAVSVYERKGPNHWDLHDYYNLTDSFTVLGNSLTLQDIYQ
ncbi:MAG: Uma2 family endonuclease [Runella slithyformis]|nr:MAG: Uma2 family endonuclease [Runella slithyformis]